MCYYLISFLFFSLLRKFFKTLTSFTLKPSIISGGFKSLVWFGKVLEALCGASKPFQVSWHFWSFWKLARTSEGFLNPAVALHLTAAYPQLTYGLSLVSLIPKYFHAPLNDLGNHSMATTGSIGLWSLRQSHGCLNLWSQWLMTKFLVLSVVINQGLLVIFNSFILMQLSALLISVHPFLP